MRPTKIFTTAGLNIAMALAGCANDPNSALMTSSVAKPKPVKVAVDPTCTALTAMINSARQEGTPARVRAVATAKSTSAPMTTVTISTKERSDVVLTSVAPSL